MAAGAPALSRRRAWWLALRPFSYTAAVVPVLVGAAAAAEEEFRPALFLLALAGSVLILAGTNLATDFFDFVDGVQPRASFGAAMQSGLLPPRSVHLAALGCFALGSLCGLIIVAEAGWPILAAGVAAVLGGYFYVASPVAYGRRGLGEVGVFFFMGPLMVMASFYVQTERLSWGALWASLPVGLLVANILHANNLRDIENDRARGKLTIAGLVGRPAADYLLWLLSLGAFAAVLVCVLLGALPASALLALFALPAAGLTFRALRHREALALNALVRAAGRLHLHFGLLLALGLALAAA